MKIFVPSYGRADCSTTMGLIPSAKIVVPQSQLDDYEKNYPGRVIAVDDSQDGSSPKKKNAILSLMEEGELAWVLDDDLKDVYNIKKQQKVTAIEELLESTYNVCQEIGAGFAGFSTTNDIARCNEYKPFSINKISYCAILLHKSDLRHDERLIRTSDIDFFVQTMKSGKIAWRDNRYFFDFVMNRDKEVLTQKGGIRGGAQKHAKYQKLLIEKWGPIIRTKNGKVVGVKLPIKGC